MIDLGNGIMEVILLKHSSDLPPPVVRPGRTASIGKMKKAVRKAAGDRYKTSIISSVCRTWISRTRRCLREPWPSIGRGSDFADALVGFLNRCYGYATAGFDRQAGRKLGFELLKAVEGKPPGAAGQVLRCG